MSGKFSRMWFDDYELDDRCEMLKDELKRQGYIVSRQVSEMIEAHETCCEYPHETVLDAVDCFLKRNNKNSKQGGAMNSDFKFVKYGGICVGIYQSKDIGNCSNNGISSRCKSVTLVGGGSPQIFEPCEDRPAVIIVNRKIGSRDYLTAYPAIKNPETGCWEIAPVPAGSVGWMAGGTFIYGSDSRFRFDYPVPLHDRSETQEEYDLLSR